MRVKIRKFGERKYHWITYATEDTGDCPFCEAARYTDGNGVIYLQKQGERTVERCYVRRLGELIATMHDTISEAEARASIAIMGN